MTTSSPAKGSGPSRAFLVNVALGTGLYVAMYGALFAFWPFRYESLDTQARFFNALMLCVAPAVFIHIAFAACLRALHDEVSDRDPFGGHESYKWKINSRVYMNSIEQWSMFLPMILAASVYLPAERYKVVPVAVTLWTLGRIMFWVGYRIAPPKRNLGMEFTAYSFSSLLIWMVVTAVL